MPQAPGAKRTHAPRRPRPLSAGVLVPTSTQRRHLTYHDKLRIIDFYHAHQGLPGITQKTVVQHFHSEFPKLSQSTLSGYLAQEQEIRAYVERNPRCLAYKQPLRAALPEVEAALTEWVHERLRRGIRLTGDFICEKARQFCDDLNVPHNRRIGFSNGWLDRFKERLGLREVWFHGEAASAPIDLVAPEQARLQQLMEHYTPRNCYNFDEMAKFFRAVPKRGLGFEQTSGVKDDKTRISLGLCTNVDGSDKRNPLFIGHYEKPHAFKGHTGAELGYDYEFNSNAWMTNLIWERWLTRFNADMRQQNRHVLLLCDNASSHKKFDAKRLSNVRVEFLAPKLTAFIQPLDAGVIQCFKAHYRCGFLRKALERDAEGVVNPYRIDQLEGMKLSVRAWDQVAPSTIANCWRHTGICPPSWFPSPTLEAPEDPVMDQLQGDLEALASTTGEQLLSAREFADLDHQVETEEELTDEMIIQQVKLLLSL